MVEDTFPAVHTWASSDLLSQQRASDQSTNGSWTANTVFTPIRLHLCLKHITERTCIFTFPLSSHFYKRKLKRIQSQLCRQRQQERKSGPWLADMNTMASPGFIKSKFNTGKGVNERWRQSISPLILTDMKGKALRRLGPSQLHCVYCVPPFLSPDFQYLLQSLTFISIT